MTMLNAPPRLTLTDQDAEDAARILRRLLGHYAPSASLVRLEDSVPSTAEQDFDRSTLISAARKAYLQRRSRAKFFPSSMFAEPAWDMMITLYCVSDTVGWMSIGRLTSFAEVPNTTGLRWIDYLEKHEFLKRKSAPLDGRSVLVGLTAKGAEGLDQYFSHLLSRGD